MKAHLAGFLVVSLLSWLTVAGCSPKLGVLDSDLAHTLETVRIISIIPQEQVGIRARESGAGAMFGIAGDFADVAVGIANANAKESLSSLREAASDLDFRAVYSSRLETGFEERDWPDDLVFETRESRIPKREFRATIEELKEDAALVLDIQYFLSPSALVLVVQTRARLYRARGAKKVYTNNFTYYSQPVGSRKNGAAIARWSENGAKRYRACVDEGIEESMKMVRRYILKPTKDSENPGYEKVRLVYEDPIKDVEARWSGYIVSREGNRVLVQYKTDEFYSLPSAWIKSQ